MNIEQANTVPLSVILDKLNCKIHRQKTSDWWYLSPFRKEKTPSFHIHTNRNKWFDFGEDAGGDTVAFAQYWLKHTKEDHTVADALRWIGIMSGNTPLIAPVMDMEDSKIVEDKKLIVRSFKTIEAVGLKHYLQKRGIPLNLAKKYLKELRVVNKAKNTKFTALGFQNEDKGFEIRVSFFKGCAGPKNITIIRGANPESKSVNIYEGFMDFLSVLAHFKVSRPQNDTIILNSLSLLHLATPFLSKNAYEKVYTLFDNDNAGEKGRIAIQEFIDTQQHMVHIPCNAKYRPHKDVNDWHLNNIRMRGMQ